MFYLRGVVVRAIRSIERWMQLLLPDVTATVSLLGVQQIPAIVRRHESGIDDMVRRIHRLESITVQSRRPEKSDTRTAKVVPR